MSSFALCEGIVDKCKNTYVGVCYDETRVSNVSMCGLKIHAVITSDDVVNRSIEIDNRVDELSWLYLHTYLEDGVDTLNLCGNALCSKKENPLNCWDDCPINKDTLWCWSNHNCVYNQRWFLSGALLLLALSIIGYNLLKPKKEMKKPEEENQTKESVITDKDN